MRLRTIYEWRAHGIVIVPRIGALLLNSSHFAKFHSIPTHTYNNNKEGSDFGFAFFNGMLFGERSQSRRSRWPSTPPRRNPLLYFRGPLSSRPRSPLLRFQVYHYYFTNTTNFNSAFFFVVFSCLFLYSFFVFSNALF